MCPTIDGNPLGPFVKLLMAVSGYKPCSRKILLSSPFSFATLIAAIRHLTLPAAHVKTGDHAGVPTRDKNTRASVTFFIQLLAVVKLSCREACKLLAVSLPAVLYDVCRL